MTDQITIPRALLEQALETLDNIPHPPWRNPTLTDAIRAELAKPEEASHTAMQLAAMVLSDCGISTDFTALLMVVAARITRHEDELIENVQKRAKPVTDVVVTKNKSGQIVAVTLQDEDGRVMEVIDKSTPATAWHDAPEVAALKSEIERLKELADSEGTRAVEYLRRARKAEAEIKQLRKDAERLDYIEESGNFGVTRYRSGPGGPVLIEAEDGKKDISKSASSLRDAIDSVIKEAKGTL